MATGTQFSEVYNRSYSIYKLENTINHLVYIGLTYLEPKERWKDGEGYKEQFIYQDIKKFGWNNFSHTILEQELTYLEARDREQFWIDYYDSYNNGYNQNKGGGGPTKHSQEEIEKIKNSLNKFWASPEGKNKAKIQSEKIKGEGNPMYGKKHSEETKRKQSELMKTLKNNNLNQFGIKNRRSRPVYCEEMNKFFGSVQEAMRLTKIDASSIVKSCKYNKKAGGYQWRYADDNEIIELREALK